MPPLEVEQAVLHGLDSQLLWGSDYPHLEGTFVYPDGRDMPSVTRLYSETRSATFLRRRRAGWWARTRSRSSTSTPTPSRRSRARSTPTIEELGTPIDAVPEGASVTAFRSGAAAGAETQRLMALQMVEGRANSGSGPSAVVAHPDLELVGCCAWSPDKVGPDVDELCGVEQVGVHRRRRTRP